MNEDLIALAAVAVGALLWLQLITTDMAMVSAQRHREAQFLAAYLPVSDEGKRW